MVEISYVDIAKQLRDQELHVDEIYNYVDTILNDLQADKRSPPDLKKATQDLFELIEEIEKESIKKKVAKKLVDLLVQDYLQNLKKYIEE